MDLKHKIQVKGILFKFLNPELFKQNLRKFDGQECYLTISKLSNQRSDNQNRYYWGVVIEILSKEIGYQAEEMHEILRAKFLNYKIELQGDSIQISKSTTKLTTKEFEEYLNTIRVWASTELSVSIPEPNEVDY